MPNEWETLREEVESLRQEFPEQAYLLYAMGLRLRTMDYDTLATDCVLDGSDDNKIVPPGSLSEYRPNGRYEFAQ